MKNNQIFRLLKRHTFPITVFITGACVLIVEIVATRVLSPFFGNTIYTVSSVISVILGALSIGYYWGGRMADRHPTVRWFFGIILLSGLVLLLFHFIGTVTLPMLGYVLSISFGPLFFSVLLFFTPALLLGMLSPYAVRLQNDRFPYQGVGSVAGKMFFWSTLGSITGSLLAGFVLIPHFGVDQIIIANGVLLFFLGLIPLMLLGKGRYLYELLCILAILIGAALYVPYVIAETPVYSKNGIYEKLIVFDGEFGGRPTRFFQQDRTSSGAMFLDSDDPQDLVYNYTKYYSIYKAFNPDIKHALVIGGGAYSIPKALLADSSEVIVDVAEIEPSLYDLSKKYFGLKDSPRLHNHIEDGRRLLHDTDTKYDLIFSDVYYSLSVPPHFTTQEFFEIAKGKLKEDGIFVANVIGDLSPQKKSLIFSEMKTFQSVFPNSYFFAVDSPNITWIQNIMFVGYNSDKVIALDVEAVTSHPDPVISSLQYKRIHPNRFDLSAYPLLTDDYSPAEYLMGQALQRDYE